MSAARVFVVGDIHGCLLEVSHLLDTLCPTAADKLIFLGDYIDRGDASKQVIDRLIRLRQEGPQCVFLRGNHEEMFLSFLGLGGAHGEVFLRNGGAATLRSYGAETSLSCVPQAHVDFLQSLDLMHRHDRFLCVHAGLRPDRPLEMQTTEDLVWIREEWLRCRHTFPFTVLFGHTPREQPFIDLPYKIGLDTGLVYGNRLSCLELNEMRLTQVARATCTVESRRI